MIIALILAFILIDIVITSTIILFESDSKKIIFWCLICAITSIIGYTIYIIFYSDKGQAKKSLLTKEKEDEIYKKLVGFELEDKQAQSEFINFNKKIYSTDFYTNSNLEILKSNEEFNSRLVQDIDSANDFIIIDTKYFLFGQNKDNICYALKEKANLGVKVKVIYSKLKKGDKVYLKELKESGIRCCKFNKFSAVYGYYKNNKNIISIDGATCYLYTHHTMNNTKQNIEYLDLFYRLQGDITKSMDLDAHLDVTFATQKFYPIEKYKKSNIKSSVEMQYIANNINNNFLDLLLKAIIEAKNSIVIHVDKFIPNDAILQALKIAVKSNIEVKLMISNINRQCGYYTSRSYVKEIARDGVTCYFYDGHIDSNYIIIDDEMVLIGNFSIVSKSLTCDLQDILIVNDKKYAEEFTTYFYDSINNSYKLCNPKRVLFREKFFRKFL